MDFRILRSLPLRQTELSPAGLIKFAPDGRPLRAPYHAPNLAAIKLLMKAHTLAHKCAQNEPDAVEEVRKFLVGIGSSISDVEHLARAGKEIEIVQAYVRREPDTVVRVDKLLAEAGESMLGFMVDAHTEKLNDIERIDRLIAIESRRNASLREIDRRRAILGETLRRAVHEIEENDFKLTEATPAKKRKTPLDE